MSAELHKEIPPVVLLPKRVQITPVLGKIKVHDADLAAVMPSNNSTRWIFDVEGRVEGGVTIQLLGCQSGQPVQPDLVAGSFLPRSQGFHEARPFIEQIEGGKLVLRHADPRVSCKYRICLDTMHSATR